MPLKRIENFPSGSDSFGSGYSGSGLDYLRKRNYLFRSKTAGAPNTDAVNPLLYCIGT